MNSLYGKLGQRHDVERQIVPLIDINMAGVGHFEKTFFSQQAQVLEYLKKQGFKDIQPK